jgi:hypothetical protein
MDAVEGCIKFIQSEQKTENGENKKELRVSRTMRLII